VSTRKVIMGNHAVSYGVKLSRVKVIAAYPITPQTQIVEMLSEMCADGELDARFLKVESEHSALASIIGAASTGVRSFTATSAQGLALMHELIHWSAGARLPIVMANVNRAMAPGWSIWADQLDSLSQRDTGWLQVYCESNQEILDLTILSFRLAEAVLMPVMVVYDAFILSHTSEPVDILDAGEADAFLPPYQHRPRLDTANPVAVGGLTAPDYYFEFRYMMQRAQTRALSLFGEYGAEFGGRFGRPYGVVETIDCEDADLVVVTVGAITSTARLAVAAQREQGKKVGLLKLRLFRPFPAEAVREAVGSASRVAVVDRNLSVGIGGVFAQEVRAALYDRAVRPLVFGYVAGLGGRDITVEDFVSMMENARRRNPDDERIIYHGIKEENLHVESE
jgi:pyruvate/2-oxoacid:ferredoxin oxidoreductase alpha subunit